MGNASMQGHYEDAAGAALALGARVEWERSWSPAVAEAFAHLPYDPLMDPELVRRLWEDGVGRDRQKIAVVRAADGTPVGVVPLRKRGKLSWQLLTQYVMPYARFHVLPEYTEAALKVVGRELDCSNVSFARLPSRTRMLRPEESWVVQLEPTYDALMKRTKYGRKDRQCRQRSSQLTLLEDRYADLPAALDCWQTKWRAAGSPATAGRRDDLLLGFGVLAEQGRLKTFSLHDGDTLAAMIVNFIGPDRLYFLLTATEDAYKQDYAGIRNLLASMEWACAAGLDEYDMLRTSGHYKRLWAAPDIRGYRVVRSPFGSDALGSAVESTKEFLWNLRHKEAS